MPADWMTFATEAPEYAGRVRSRLQDGDHHVLATLHRDGAPRLNGTNVVFDGDDLLVGFMPGTRRGADLRRDPRCALHSAPDSSDLARGDVRLECTAVLLDPDRTRAVLSGLADAQGTGASTPSEGDLFALHLRSVSLLTVDDDALVIERWSPGNGMQRLDRR